VLFPNFHPKLMGEGNCVFCSIAARNAPAHRVYEDDMTLAFLDTNPLADFHTLLIPKRHVTSFEDCDDAAAAAMGVSLKRLSCIMRELRGDFNILLSNGKKAGQEVWHSHFHLIPREGRQDGLGYRWKAGQLPAQVEITDFCDKAMALYKS